VSYLEYIFLSRFFYLNISVVVSVVSVVSVVVVVVVLCLHYFVFASSLNRSKLG